MNIEALKEYTDMGFHFTFTEFGCSTHYFSHWNSKTQRWDIAVLDIFCKKDWTPFELFATLDLWIETHLKDGEFDEYLPTLQAA